MYHCTLSSPLGKFDVVIDPVSNAVKFEIYTVFSIEHCCQVAQLRIQDLEWCDTIDLRDYYSTKRYSHVWVKRGV